MEGLHDSMVVNRSLCYHPTSMEWLHESMVKHQQLSMLPSHIYGMTSRVYGQTSTALYVTIPHLWNEFTTLWSNIDSSLCYHPTSMEWLHDSMVEHRQLSMLPSHVYGMNSPLYGQTSTALYVTIPHLWNDFTTLWSNINSSLCYHPTSMEWIHHSMVKHRQLSMLPSHIYGRTSPLYGQTSTALYVTIPHLWKDFTTLWSNIDSSLCYHPTSMEGFHDSMVKHQQLSMLPSHIYGMNSRLYGQTSTALYVTIPHLWNEFTTLWSNIDSSLCYHPTSMEWIHHSMVKHQQLSMLPSHVYGMTSRLYGQTSSDLYVTTRCCNICHLLLITSLFPSMSLAVSFAVIRFRVSFRCRMSHVYVV